ncbi:hypothetical protein ACJRO7_013984 [Eucalyptus globulus]|uniref:F-box/LRR-repeat protein 15/At3g58940/PEG3-like LRR domain-containing protein n=1 Tax=Eucalyptus globulus TaxID=34317 RepID=A0ABD3KYN5_EUCGL
MEDLPVDLILDILGRLPDSADVARFRAASRTLNAAARGVKSVALLCSLARYLRSRSPDTRSLAVPFKSLVASAVLGWGLVESVAIGIDYASLADSFEDVEEDESGYDTDSFEDVEEDESGDDTDSFEDVEEDESGDDTDSFEDMEEDEYGDDTDSFEDMEEDESGDDTDSFEDTEEEESGDDMSLMEVMEVGFLEGWLPRVSEELRALSISDLREQSSWRRSNVLALVSSHCRSLCELELKNAWLSVDGLNPLPSLTSLTLESITLDDENLSKLFTCLSHLQVLNLHGVGGLKEPKIHLPDLRSCQWTVSNAPISLAIYAPRLVKLMLSCITLRSLILETPALSDFDLSIVQADDLQVKDLISLKSLKLYSPFLCNLITAFPSAKTVEKLTLNTEFEMDGKKMISLELLFKTFPNASTLTLGPDAWSRLWPSPGGWEDGVEMKSLQGNVACVVDSHIDVVQAFIASMMDKCTNLSDFTILMRQQDADSDLLSNLTKRCTADWPRLKWKFGVFKKATEAYGFTGGWDIVWQRQTFEGAR